VDALFLPLLPAAHLMPSHETLQLACVLKII
jgi:hypothetical protein